MQAASVSLVTSFFGDSAFWRGEITNTNKPAREDAHPTSECVMYHVLRMTLQLRDSLPA